MKPSGDTNHFLLIMGVSLGVLLNPLNTSMIAVALFRLQEDFSLSFMDISWLISSYYLASMIMQPVMGKLSDSFGRKRIFLIGLACVIVSSSLAPFSPGFGWLLAFRIVQALGTSALFPSGMDIVRTTVKENQARAFGILTALSTASAALGPFVGGLLIYYGDWPLIFIVNLPLIAISMILVLKTVPADEPRKEFGTVDIWGFVLFILLNFIWVWFLLRLSEGAGWLELGIGVAAALIFYLYEYRHAQPFVDVRYLKHNRGLTFVHIQNILVNIVFYSIFFGIPLYAQNVLAMDSKETGFIMLSLFCVSVLITPVTGRWIDRKGPHLPLMVGIVVLIAGTLLLTAFRDDSGTLLIFGVVSILGVGLGIIGLGLQMALHALVPVEETGSASGLFMTSRYVGTLLSSSVLGFVFGDGISTGGLHWMAVFCAVTGGMMLVLTFVGTGANKRQM